MAGGQFNWKPGGALPKIERHSNAKLELLELYLSRYFDTLAVDPRQDRLAISFVDGFSGGGKYADIGGLEREGSPFVLLRTAEEAEKRLNQQRKKPLSFECRYYFVDTNKRAIDFLHAELEKAGYADAVSGGGIDVRNAQFEGVAGEIIADIKARQRGGRSIFVLDQKGWSDVQFSTVRRILTELPASEVLLTFAVDWLITYLNDGKEFQQAWRRAGFKDEQIAEYVAARGDVGYRYLIPRLLLRDIQELTQAAFISPFFLRSAAADRDLWIVHLSKLTTARNVMVSAHWDISNADTMSSSIHQGPAGLKMLGFDPHWENALPLDFGFEQSAAGAIANALQSELPATVASLGLGAPPTVEALLANVANNTAATKAQLQAALIDLHRAGELDILAPGGNRKRSDVLTKLDRVCVARQQRLFSFR